jgi:hypothetical protein
MTGVVRAGPEHAETLAEFYRATWDASATAAGVRAARRDAADRNTSEPGREPPTFLFLLGGRPVGHVTTLPLRLWTAEGTTRGYWMKGLMVAPEHRNGPVGFLLLREAVKDLGLSMAMVVAPEARRLFTAAGFADLGALPDAVRILDPARVLLRVDPSALPDSLPGWMRRAAAAIQRSPAASALAGAAASIGIGGWTAARDSARLHRGWVLPRLDADEATLLWQRARRRISAAPSRDAGDLLARYDGRGEYRLIGVRERGGLAALGILRAPRASADPRLNGIRMAALADVVCPVDRPGLLLALLSTAETTARGLDADALLFSASHRSTRAALRRRAYLPMGGGVHVMVRNPAGTPLPAALADWWVTRGDGHADEAF